MQAYVTSSQEGPGDQLEWIFPPQSQQLEAL